MNVIFESPTGFVFVITFFGAVVQVTGTGVPIYYANAFSMLFAITKSLVQSSRASLWPALAAVPIIG